MGVGEMKTYKDFFSYLKSSSMILLAAALAVACGGSGGSTVANVPGISNGNIVGELGSTSNLVGGGTLLYDTVADNGSPAYPSIEFSLQFWGNTYQGIVAAQGVMTVQDTSCNIPVGQYQIETYQQAAGLYSSNGGPVVQNLYMVTTSGPASLQLAAQSLSIYQPSGTVVNRDVYGVQHPLRIATNQNILVYMNNYPACTLTLY